MNNNFFDTEEEDDGVSYWGIRSSIGKQDTPQERYSNAKDDEIEFKNNLNSSNGYKAFRYTMKDKNGKEIAQTIKTKYGIVRCPDIFIICLDWDMLVLRVEIKRTRKLFNNSFVRVEIDSFEDYLKVQSSEEVEGRIVFIVDSENKIYWQNLDKLDSKKKVERISFGDGTEKDFYIWNIKDLNVFTTSDEFLLGL